MCNSSISSSVRPLDPVKPVDTSSVIPSGSSRASSTSNSTSTAPFSSTSTSTSKSGSWTITGGGSLVDKPGEKPVGSLNLGTSYTKGSVTGSLKGSIDSKGSKIVEGSLIIKLP